MADRPRQSNNGDRMKYTPAILIVLSLAACSDVDVPILRTRADTAVTAPTDTNDPVAAQCEQIRDQIRANQESSREAVAVSTNPQIVAAAQGKADQRIGDLHDRLDALDCADQAKQDPPDSPVRIAPLPPAPNAPN
jgi:hypothetical protein